MAITLAEIVTMVIIIATEMTITVDTPTTQLAKVMRVESKCTL